MLDSTTELIDLQDIPKLQSDLSDHIHEAQYQSLLQDMGGGNNQIRLESVKASGGFWFRGRTGIAHNVLSDIQVIFGFKWRLGIPLHSTYTLGSRCTKCSNHNDVFGMHVHSCRSYQSLRTERHTAIKNMWTYLFRLAGFQCRAEPRGQYPSVEGQSDRQPDHKVAHFDLSNGKSLLTDVAVVFPFSQTTLQAKEVEKKDRYCPGLPADTFFAPLVVDAYGRWGSKAKSIMAQSASHCYQHNLSFFDRKGSFEYYSWTALDTLLQKQLLQMYSAFCYQQVEAIDSEDGNRAHARKRRRAEAIPEERSPPGLLPPSCRSSPLSFSSI